MRKRPTKRTLFVSSNAFGSAAVARPLMTPFSWMSAGSLGFAALGLLTRFDKRLTGQRDVAVFFANLNGAVTARDAVRKMRRPPGFHAHSVEFGDLFCQGKQLWRRNGDRRAGAAAAAADELGCRRS